jgi:hypothetical protein
MDDNKEIPGFPEYKISRSGIAIGKHGRVLTPHVHKGYADYGLYRDGRRYWIPVHQLLARTYVPNPKKYKQVYHLDGNNLHNHADNVAWCTSKDTANRVSAGDNGTNCKCTVLNVVTGKTIEYLSLKALSLGLGVSRKTVIGYIKYSYEFPFMGKYTISINNVENFISDSYKKPVSKPIYVYDIVSGEEVYYPSMAVARYELGTHTIQISVKTQTILYLGYLVAYSSEELNNVMSDINYPVKSDILIAREILMETTYRRSALHYLCRDVRSNCTRKFNSKISIVRFININSDITLTLNAISIRLSRAAYTGIPNKVGDYLIYPIFMRGEKIKWEKGDKYE